MIVVPLSLDYVLPEEANWMREALSITEEPHSLLEVFAEVSQKQARIWRLLDNDLHGILVTESVDWNTGKALRVWILGGRGVAVHLGRIWKVLTKMARDTGHLCVLATTTPRLARIYTERHGAKVIAVQVMKEL